MTVNDVVTQLKRENRESTKTDRILGWCATVDNAAALTMRVEGYTPLRFPEDLNRELLITSPHEQAYFYYCCAMMDLSGRQYSDYQNMISVFENEYNAFAKRHIRENRPPYHGGVRI